MCGITGIKAFSGRGKQFLSRTSESVYRLRSRGPDGEGLFFREQVALGHRRLSIIDTSGQAAQPMTDSSGRYTIVFNGEIFNFPELKKELIAKGMRFRSGSDTEVLLELYAREKAGCLPRLDGEFAFAVYDSADESLFLARDRFGIKPLYYFSDEHTFIFASELKALMAYPIPKKLDHASLRAYLHLNYIPAPDTVFEQVKKFPAGSFARIDGPAFAFQPYYACALPDAYAHLEYGQAQAELNELLSDSVRKRMVSDVPLGCFLSGGIDSSIVSAIAARHTSRLNTFSIGYRDEKLFDETAYARLVASKLNTEHTVFELTNEDLFANLHAVLEYTDEPFADSSALAVHILAMHTRKHVKVALSGDGADELFGGYNKHAAEWQLRNSRLGKSLLRTSAGVLKKLPASRNSKSGNRIRQLKKLSEGARLDQKERYWRWAGFCTEAELDRLFEADDRLYRLRKKGILHGISDDFNSVLLTDLQLVLENDMLVKVDRMSMANSLEVRVPFLQHGLADFALSLPASLKLDGRRRKKILKDAFKNELPEEVFRRGKQGFEVPLLTWLRTGLRSMISDELLNKKFIREQGLFDSDETDALQQQLYSGNPGDAAARIWGLLVFQYWWKKYMNN
ncbi:MAG: asparagine synthase (glutamine-hydrolyzing) [Bacteroidota bacterium]